MSLNAWTALALVIYLLIVIAIGFGWGRGRGRTDEEWFVAGRHLNGWQDGLAIFATAVQAGALTGTVGLFYASPGNMLGYCVAYLAVAPVVYWLVGSRLRRLGSRYKYQTQADFLGHVYGSRFLKVLVTVLVLVFQTVYFATAPIAMGLILHQYFGWPYVTGVILFLAVTLSYSIYGGLRAIANTDVFHGVLLILFWIVSMPLLIIHAGGLGKVFNQPVTTLTVSNNGVGLWIFLTWIVILGVNYMAMPDRALRTFSVKDDAQLQRSALIAGVTVGGTSAVFFLLGATARVITPGVTGTATDTVLASTMSHTAAWLVPFYVVSLWGAGMSFTGAGLLTVSNSFVQNVFKPFVQSLSKSRGTLRDLESRQAVLTGRLVLVVLAGLALYVAGVQPPFIWSVIAVPTSIFMQLVPPAVAALFWPRSSKRGAEGGLAVGVVVTLMFLYWLAPPFNYKIAAGVLGMAANIAVLVVLSLLIPDSKEETSRRNQLRQASRAAAGEVGIGGTEQAPPTTVLGA